MKIVSILASPKGKKGNTGQLLDAMLASIKKTGATVKQFDLAKTKIEPCTDCGLCHRTGDCPIKDDFPKIRNAMIRMLTSMNTPINRLEIFSILPRP